jgi:D-alanyl-D-alanine carboxypeptidase
MMTRKAHALGMSRTVYRNASGLPNDEQVTTARDQSILGRALQDRFPRYYRYFSTTAFTFRGHTIHGHNHLLGSVEGVDGIKTGYTRGSGFNLVTSMHRGNRFLIGVVLGGHSGSSRDAIMRNLLAENLEKAATKRTVAAITDRNASESGSDVADADAGPAQPSPMQLASADPAEAPASAPAPAQPAAPAKSRMEPAPLTSGVIQTQPIATIPGSTEPMKPVKVRTVQVKAQPVKLASVTPAQPSPPTTSSVAPVHPETADSSNVAGARPVVEKTEVGKPEPSSPETPAASMPPQPPGFGTGNGILGVLPASSLPPSPSSQAMAYAEPAQPQPQTSVSKPAVVRTGWIVQVGALDSEDEAQQRIEAARDKAHGLLSKADPFTETVMAKGDHKLFRARFAGLDRDKAEAVCKALKRADISCMTVRN